MNVTDFEGKKHGTPEMWKRAVKRNVDGTIDEHATEKILTGFDLGPKTNKTDPQEEDFGPGSAPDLVLVSSAQTTYGQIILGKIRLPGVKDEHGEGFVHVRYVTEQKKNNSSDHQID